MNHTTRRQHHIPRMFLKNFTDCNGQMCMYNFNTKKIIGPSSLTNIAVQKDLYSLMIDGKPDDMVEKFFAKIEAEADLTIREFIINEQDHEYSLENIIRFIGLLISRTPDMVKDAHEKSRSDWIYESLIEGVKEGQYSQEEMENYIHNIADTPGLLFGQTIPHISNEMSLNLARNFDFIIYTSNKKAFILTDTCMVIENLDPKQDANSQDWWEWNIRIHFPITSHTCITCIPKIDPERKGSGDIKYVRKIIPHAYVEHINKLNIKNTLGCNYIYHSDKRVLRKYKKKYL